MIIQSRIVRTQILTAWRHYLVGTLEQVGFKVGINDGCLINFHFEPLSSNNMSFFPVQKVDIVYEGKA